MTALPRSEPSEAGEQYLVTGVQPVTMRQRLELVMIQPLLPKREQRPLDVGFWNPMRNQFDLF